MNDLVRLGKALSDPTRVRILRALLDSELCVCEIVDGLELGQSTVSSHMQWLRNSGLVTAEKRGTWVIYHVASHAEPVLRQLFVSFPSESAQEAADRERFALRRMMRVDGCCVVGFRSALKEASLV
jgi:ArsR family transcriptional regulator, arsenate/arsenite/antimonite-responsive transcriptional repressor